MKYLIPLEKLAKLTKKIAHIKNKCSDIIFSIDFNKREMLQDAEGFYHECVEVVAEGEYKVSGWEFIATLEHTENGNIIRKAVSIDVPDYYKTCLAKCDHCNTARTRKDTYIIRNIETGEFKQVGKSCLLEYTKGLDASICAEIASFISVIEDNQFDANADYDEFILDLKANNSKKIDATYFKNLAYDEVKQNGYISKKTVKILCNKLFDEKEKDNSLELDKITDWINSVDISNSDYLSNAKVAWNLKYLDYRDFALVASTINSYFKDLSRKAKEAALSASTAFVGQVGDRIVINVADILVLYTRDNSQYSYYAESSVVYKIIDTKGNVYIWNTSKSQTEILSAVQIEGSIKKHSEFRGEKQTIITKAKVLR